jgi:hypothetical protein
LCQHRCNGVLDPIRNAPDQDASPRADHAVSRGTAQAGTCGQSSSAGGQRTVLTGSLPSALRLTNWGNHRCDQLPNAGRRTRCALPEFALVGLAFLSLAQDRAQIQEQPPTRGAMEIQQVKYFLAACEELSFTRAAKRCNVAQPSLSAGLRRLERELGGQLFVRAPTGVHLTQLGRAVMPHFEQINRHAECARKVATGAATTANRMRRERADRRLARHPDARARKRLGSWSRSV